MRHKVLHLCWQVAKFMELVLQLKKSKISTRDSTQSWWISKLRPSLEPIWSIWKDSVLFGHKNVFAATSIALWASAIAKKRPAFGSRRIWVCNLRANLSPALTWAATRVSSRVVLQNRSVTVPRTRRSGAWKIKTTCTSKRKSKKQTTLSSTWKRTKSCTLRLRVGPYGAQSTKKIASWIKLLKMRKEKVRQSLLRPTFWAWSPVCKNFALKPTFFTIWWVVCMPLWTRTSLKASKIR